MYYKILEFHNKPGFHFVVSEYNPKNNVFEVLHFEFERQCMFSELTVCRQSLTAAAFLTSCDNLHRDLQEQFDERLR